MLAACFGVVCFVVFLKLDGGVAAPIVGVETDALHELSALFEIERVGYFIEEVPALQLHRVVGLKQGLMQESGLLRVVVCNNLDLFEVLQVKFGVLEIGDR